ncbi:MAG: hypothetical protein K0S38_719 [Candidatus Paceibacter sp.]|jgi:hypothetical protein|nr:hypothetical protein [Candidatus Paceibacter sp.]
MLDRTQASDLDKLLALPFSPLIERMIDNHGWSEQDALQGFEDLMRYFFLCAAHKWSEPFAPPPKIDEIWHAFILFTKEYRQFCFTFFGRFIEHRPRRRSDPPNLLKPISYTQQAALELYGRLSDMWINKPYTPKEKPQEAKPHFPGRECSTECSYGNGDCA